MASALRMTWYSLTDRLAHRLSGWVPLTWERDVCARYTWATHDHPRLDYRQACLRLIVLHSRPAKVVSPIAWEYDTGVGLVRLSGTALQGTPTFAGHPMRPVFAPGEPT